jgi:predicted nucleotidyltransferase
VQQRAQIESVAIFGVLTTGSADPEDPFDIICELTGGVELFATKRTLDQTLQELVTMVRHRYILEFPRSDDFKPGHHSIAVSILKSKAYIRTTGVTFRVADPKVLADPTRYTRLARWRLRSWADLRCHGSLGLCYSSRRDRS